MSRSVEAQGLAALLNLDAYVEQVEHAQAQAADGKAATAQTPGAPLAAPAAATATTALVAEKAANGLVTDGLSDGRVSAPSSGGIRPGRATAPANENAAAALRPAAPSRPRSSTHPDFVDTQPAHKQGHGPADAADDAHSAGAAAAGGQGAEPQQSLGRVGPYELRAALPHDGLGQVFRGWDSTDGIDVMVTLLDLDAAARDRAAVIAQMQKSVLAAAALQHPGLARILDAGVVGEGVYIVNEWTAGRTLGLAQRAGWQPTARVAACVVRDLATALAHAHAHGVLHGGLNPSTVLLDANDQASVLGLGFAATAHASDLPSMDPLVSGAAPYLAPEQLQGGGVDERTDVHALGVLLYELLAGHRAYPGETIPEVARALMSHDPAPPHWLRLDVPERLSAIAMQALQRNPAARYLHASQVAAALSAWLEESEGDTEEAREYFVNAEAQPKPGAKKSHWVSGLLLAAAAMAAAFYWAERPDQSSLAADTQPPAVVAPAAAGNVKAADTAADAGAANAAPAATNAESQPSAALPVPLPVQEATPQSPAAPAAATPSPAVPKSAAATEVPAGQVQALTAVVPLDSAVPTQVAQVSQVAPVAQVPPVAQVAQAPQPAQVDVPASVPKAPARPAAKPRATPSGVTNPPQGGKAAAREKTKPAAAESRAVAPVVVQTGTVQLAVSPWGYVEVNGKPAGASPPLHKLTLPEGRHTITIRNEDFPPYSTTVQVTADKAATVRYRFAQ